MRPTVRKPASIGPLIVAFLLPLYTGLSPMTLDQLADPLAALRLLQGQTPYLDFQTPYGPLAFIVLSLFLALFPTPGWGLLFASSLLNTAAAYLTREIASELKLNREWIGFATLLSAIWFLPPFGSFFHDHLAYCLLIASFLFSLRNRHGFAAICVAMSFHSKQTVGLIGLAAIGLCYLMRPLACRPIWKPLLGFFVSYVSVHALILAGIWAFADFPSYWSATIEAPFSYCQFKADKHPMNAFFGLFFPFGIRLFEIKGVGLGRLSFYPVVLAVYASLFFLPRLQNSQRVAMVFFLSTTLWCAAFLSRAFTHVFLGLPIVFTLVSSLLPKRIAAIGLLFCSVLGLLQIAYLHPLSDLQISKDSTWKLAPLRPPAWFYPQSASALAELLNQKGAPWGMLGQQSALVPTFVNSAPISRPAFYFDGLTIPWDEALRAKWEADFLGVLKQKQAKYLVTEVNQRLEPGLLQTAINNGCHKAFEQAPLEVRECDFSH